MNKKQETLLLRQTLRVQLVEVISTSRQLIESLGEKPNVVSILGTVATETNELLQQILAGRRKSDDEA